MMPFQWREKCSEPQQAQLSKVSTQSQLPKPVFLVWVHHSHGYEKLRGWVASHDDLAVFSRTARVQGDQVILHND
jgi:hypothetical protein